MINAVFDHEHHGKYNEVFATNGRFLAYLRRLKDSTFIHAVDYERGMTIYPSTLPEYRALSTKRRKKDYV